MPAHASAKCSSVSARSRWQHTTEMESAEVRLSLLSEFNVAAFNTYPRGKDEHRCECHLDPRYLPLRCSEQYGPGSEQSGHDGTNVPNVFCCQHPPSARTPFPFAWTAGWGCGGRKENVHVSPEATDWAGRCRRFWTKFKSGTIRFCSQEIIHRNTREADSNTTRETNFSTTRRDQFQHHLHHCNHDGQVNYPDPK